MDSYRFKICIPGRKNDVSGNTLNHEAKVPSPTSITTLGKKTMENTLFTWSLSPKGKIFLFDEWCLFSPLNFNFRSNAVDILEEAPKGGHQEANKDGHQEVANLPPFKRKRKY